MTPLLHAILDRDGVLNEESKRGTFVLDPADFRWLPGAREALALLRTFGATVSVVTNQSCIGRGVATPETVARVNDAMRRQAESAGGAIDRVLVCPHSPDDACDCRKPAPGLVLRAVRESGVPADRSILVGDDLRDLLAARAAGLRAILVRTGKGRSVESAAPSGTPVFDDLLSVCRSIADAEAA